VFDVWLTDCQKPRNAVAQQQPAAPAGEGAVDDGAMFPEEPPEMQRRRVRR
jgi:hypothetical protein